MGVFLVYTYFSRLISSLLVITRHCSSSLVSARQCSAVLVISCHRSSELRRRRGVAIAASLFASVRPSTPSSSPSSLFSSTSLAPRKSPALIGEITWLPTPQKRAGEGGGEREWRNSAVSWLIYFIPITTYIYKYSEGPSKIIFNS